MRVCVDASLIAGIVLDEPLGVRGLHLLSSWTDAELIAPDLWAYEVVAIAHKAVRRGALPAEQRSRILRSFFAFRVSLLRPPGLHELAGELAVAMGLPATYDAHYLALAQREGLEFWTGDEKLYNTVHHTLPWVHWVGESIPTRR
jgi:predicted nucleic acid-binding protein